MWAPKAAHVLHRIPQFLSVARVGTPPRRSCHTIASNASIGSRRGSFPRAAFPIPGFVWVANRVDSEYCGPDRQRDHHSGVGRLRSLRCAESEFLKSALFPSPGRGSGCSDQISVGRNMLFKQLQRAFFVTSAQTWTSVDKQRREKITAARITAR